MIGNDPYVVPCPYVEGVVRYAEIDNYLSILQDKPLVYIGRATNMLCIGFGEMKEALDHKGRAFERSTIALHIQSAWRIMNTETATILLAKSDMYFPKTSQEKSKDFNWDAQGNSLFDEKAKVWFASNAPLYVQKYKLNQYGDLNIYFSNNDLLGVFTNNSHGGEYWRLFEPYSERRHLVVSGEGVSL